MHTMNPLTILKEDSSSLSATNASSLNTFTLDSHNLKS